VRAPIPVPVLQVQGALDPVVRPETAGLDSSALCRDLRYEVLPDAGHFLPEEASDEVTSLLLDWLGGLPTPSTQG
jgi:pimeloyl-ACP methyl ester carboxylesterase